jgi:hypothetical protein
MAIWYILYSFSTFFSGFGIMYQEKSGNPGSTFFSASKLDTNCMTVATASVLFHRFLKAAKKDLYDNYVSIAEIQVLL